ncbi:MAG: methyltransferase domain-containing protein [Candidatus Hodarchaeota archaeon]
MKNNIVICSEVLEHVTNTDHPLQEINRSLKTNGILILSIPNIIQVFLDLPPVYSARYKSSHKRDFTLKLIKIDLKINGFRIEKITGTCIPPFKNKISQVLAWLFPRFSSKIIIVSKKITKPKSFPEILVVWNERLFEEYIRGENYD